MGSYIQIYIYVCVYAYMHICIFTHYIIDTFYWYWYVCVYIFVFSENQLTNMCNSRFGCPDEDLIFSSSVIGDQLHVFT